MLPRHAGSRRPRWPALLGLLALAACARQPPPNVVLVTFDTTRYDRFGCTGDPGARTPVVDALAARGLLFERAYAATGLTLPSHTTILTGVEPHVHDVHNNGRFRVPDDLETLAERLAAAGWDTAAFVSAFVLDHRFNLDQGFAVYGDRTLKSRGPLDFSVPERPAREVTDEALAWLGGRGADRPFFLWVHYYDPHRPFAAPAPFDAMPDPYAAEIAYADTELGRLLDAVATLERPAVTVFTADHGESFGAHGEETHGLLAYDSTLHVPLVLAGPGVPRGARSRAFARHADIVPTVLELTGLPVPADLPGRSLLRAAADGRGDETAVAGYFQSLGPHYDYGWAPLAGVRTARWKYTATPDPPELYDVVRDPHELDDRLEAEPAVRAEMAALYARLRETEARPGRAGGPQRLAPEQMERLAALGYIEASGRFAPGEEPDPRRFAAVFNWVDQARNAAGAGEYDLAIATLETLAHSPSVRPLVLRSLASVYAARGRVEDAVRAYRDYIALTGADEARLGLARVLLDAGRPEEARTALAAIEGRSPRTAILEAHALARLGRHDEARATIDRSFPAERGSVARLHHRAALVIDTAPLPDGERELRALLAEAPEDARLRSQLGYYLAVWGGPGQGEEALALLRAASRALPDDLDLLANLGWGAFKRDELAEAIAALEAVLERDERRDLERVRLALVLRRAGEPARARELLRLALARLPGGAWAADARAALAEIEAAGDPSGRGG